VTQKELTALADLHETDFSTYLQGRLNEVLGNMINCKDAELLRQLQGRAQMLADLMNEIVKADETRAGRTLPKLPVENRNRF
jgi:hypothetical protein